MCVGGSAFICQCAFVFARMLVQNVCYLPAAALLASRCIKCIDVSVLVEDLCLSIILGVYLS